MIKYTYMETEQNVLIKDYVNKLFTGNAYKAWTMGDGILTSQSGRFGFVLLRFRRATGTIVWTMRLLNSIKESTPSQSNNPTSKLIQPLRPPPPPPPPISPQQQQPEVELVKENIISSMDELITVDTKPLSSNPLPLDDTRLFLSLNSLNEMIGSLPIDNFDPLPSYEGKVKKKEKIIPIPLLSPRSQPEIRTISKEAVTPFPSSKDSRKKEEKNVGNTSPGINFGVKQTTSGNSTPTQSHHSPVPSPVMVNTSIVFNSPKQSPGVIQEVKKNIPSSSMINIHTTNPTPAGKEEIKINDKTMLHPNFPYIFLRNWPFLSKEEVKGLTVSKDLTRALNMFDLIQTKENSKFGIIFVDKDQHLESDILKNFNGTPRYFEFLRQLGNFNSLRDLEGQYTGGLDSSESLMDGEFVLRYEDQVSCIIYHVSTMMPTNKNDEQCILKKSHIGNDYVTIVYSENSDIYDIKTIPVGVVSMIHV
jgi:hypothetical protein